MVVLNYSSKTKVQNEFQEKLAGCQKISKWHQQKCLEMIHFQDIGPLIDYINSKSVSFPVNGNQLDAFLNTFNYWDADEW